MQVLIGHNTLSQYTRMDVSVATYILSLFLIIHSSQGLQATCGQRRLRSIAGHKCDLGQTETLHTFGHKECMYQCLRQRSKCGSMSYNAVDKLCSMTATPCLELIPHPDVRTNVFHDVSHDISQCLQWSPYHGISHERSIVYDVGPPGIMGLVRWNDPQGNILIGYTLKSSGWHRGYFKYMLETQLESPFNGCELAIIANDCSVA